MGAQEPSQPTAGLLIIGNEILSGRTQDANLAFLGQELGGRGIRLIEARVIPDIHETIVAQVNELRARVDYLFTTGGIGPTHDDITAECIAAAFGVPHELNDEAHAILKAHYREGELNEARLRMAMTPRGASLIENPVSKAPGFRMGNVFVLAGIPKIMQEMFKSLAPQLTGGPPIVSHSVTCFLPEGKVAAHLKAVQARHPALDLGSYPFQRDGRFGTQLVVCGSDEAGVAAAEEEIVTFVTELGGWE